MFDTGRRQATRQGARFLPVGMALDRVFGRPRSAAIVAVMLILAAGSVGGLDRSDLLFYASLDGRLCADFSRGSLEPVNGVAGLVFASGVRGQGVIARQQVTWDGAQNIGGAEGTLAFWLQPVDWSSPDGKSHPFAWLLATGGRVRLYQFYPGQLGMHMQSRQGTRTCWTSARLEAGTFYHLAFTWRDHEWGLYFNGRRVCLETETWVPFGEIRSFALGPDATVFDEVMVFGRALRPEEISALVRRVMPTPGLGDQPGPQPAPGVRLAATRQARVVNPRGIP